MLDFAPVPPFPECNDRFQLASEARLELLFAQLSQNGPTRVHRQTLLSLRSPSLGGRPVSRHLDVRDSWRSSLFGAYNARI